MTEFVSEAQRIERCLQDMTRIGVWLERVIRVVGAIASVAALAWPIVNIHAYFDPSYTAGTPIDQCITALPCSVLLAAVLFFIWRLVNEISKGQSPFSMRAYHALLGATASFALFALVELALNHYGFGGLLFLPFTSEVLGTGGTAAFLALLVAGLMGMMAFVFRYGMLLQQQSDCMI